MTLAAAAAAVTGVASDLAVVGHHVAQSENFTEPLMLARVCLQGLSESLSPIILGATLLCVTWLVMAVGYRRLAASPAGVIVFFTSRTQGGGLFTFGLSQVTVTADARVSLPPRVSGLFRLWRRCDGAAP